MALTNYMSGTAATEVNSLGGSALQLGVDGTYSMAMWSLAFVQTNFVLILVALALAVVVGFAVKKIRGARRGSAIVR